MKFLFLIVMSAFAFSATALVIPSAAAKKA